jgi:RNA polymerase sigma factor (sigma-70 family)
LSRDAKIWHIHGMSTTEGSSPVESGDAELVAQSLLGSREAFGQIVARYQTLICSLAYSATGSLAQSEDLAQETFVAAWRQLSGLREPAKLRPWLCGIARNLAHRAWRGQKREPTAGAAPLDRLDQLAAPGPQPMEQAMSREEEDILWRSLEGIPEVYREPLILYYRQNQSVDDVALALDLSAEAVRQRLVRGRKLLSERVLAFTEGALARSSPGRRFTQGVLSALPLAAPSGKVAALGTTWAAGGAAAKGSAVIGSLGGGLALVGGALVSAQAEAATFKSPRERKFVFKMAVASSATLLVYIELVTRPGLFFGSRFAGQIELAAAIFVAAALSSAFLVHRAWHQRRIRIDEGTFTRTDWNSPVKRSRRENLRLAAFPLIMFAVALAPVLTNPQRMSWYKRLLPLALVFLLIAILLRRLIVHARDRGPRQGGLSAPAFSIPSMFFPVCCGAVTLAQFNFGGVSAGSNMKVATPAQTIAFNLAVVLAYGLLAVILVRKRTEWKSLA